MERRHWPIPDIPGIPCEDPAVRQHLSEHVSNLCGLRENKFPGSQPVSFTLQSLDLLESMDFWVCEKSDGIRLLIFIVLNKMTGNQEVWLIDRKQRFFQVPDLHFPHWENQDDPLTDTIIDGELVIDEDPKTKQQVLRYYAFDALVLHGENIMHKSLLSRFGRLRSWVIQPFEKILKQIPEWNDNLPFQVLAKEQELSYYISRVLDVHVPNLQHGHDGLIFTCAESQYVAGTDEKILKWKPPSENSIDFKLELRFPPSAEDINQPDYTAKPVFLLNVWQGGHGYEYFDEMDVDDDEWEKMKESQEQMDDRIVECCWDTTSNGWKMLRLRDDKSDGNHKSIVEKIIKSVEDGVEIETLLSRSDSIRSAWKARAAARNGQQPPPQHQQQHQNQQNQHGQHGHHPQNHQARRQHTQPMPPTPGNGTRNNAVTPGYPQTPGGGFPASTPGVMAGLKR